MAASPSTTQGGDSESGRTAITVSPIRMGSAAPLPFGAHAIRAGPLPDKIFHLPAFE